MTVKVTFTLDEVTIRRLERAAARAGRPKSAILREAIRDFEANTDRLSEAERDRMLAALDRMQAQGPSRPRAEVDAELRELRAVRRLSGRAHPHDPA
ncbi:MAG: ribbon-helix-helix protein, CopG family [Terriglobales bacterium]